MNAQQTRQDLNKKIQEYNKNFYQEGITPYLYLTYEHNTTNNVQSILIEATTYTTNNEGLTTVSVQIVCYETGTNESYKRNLNQQQLGNLWITTNLFINDLNRGTI